jgi:hypothetical protein
MADLATRGEANSYSGWAAPILPSTTATSVNRAFVRILDHVGVNYAVLGMESLHRRPDKTGKTTSSCSDASHAEYAIATLDSWHIKEDEVTACPHCFNTIKQAAGLAALRMIHQHLSAAARQPVTARRRVVQGLASRSTPATWAGLWHPQAPSAPVLDMTCWK